MITINQQRGAGAYHGKDVAFPEFCVSSCVNFVRRAVEKGASEEWMNVLHEWGGGGGY